MICEAEFVDWAVKFGKGVNGWLTRLRGSLPVSNTHTYRNPNFH